MSDSDSQSTNSNALVEATERALPRSRRSAYRASVRSAAGALAKTVILLAFFIEPASFSTGASGPACTLRGAAVLSVAAAESLAESASTASPPDNDLSVRNLEIFRRGFASAPTCPPELFLRYRRYAAEALDTSQVELLPAHELGRCPADSVPLLGHVTWGQVVSGLVGWNGTLVFNATFHGRVLPYELAGEGAKPLFSPEQRRRTEGWTFYRLISAGPESLVMLARTRPDWKNKELFLFRRPSREAEGTITNLTATADLDEDDLCAHPPSGAVSFAISDGRQGFARLRGAALAEVKWVRRKLTSCQWLSDHELIGIPEDDEDRLVRCTVGTHAVDCAATRPLAGLVERGRLDQLAPGTFGLVAGRPEDPFRRPWTITERLTAAAPFYRSQPASDIVQVEHDWARVALLSRYVVRHETRLDDPPRDEEGVVTAIRLHDGYLYGAYGDRDTPRTIARLQDGRWHPLDVAELTLRRWSGSDGSPPPPREVWLRYGDGELVQAYYFGADNPTQAVIWWHGGPRDNISPRYNPYFHFLNEQGFGVLAVNFPGSAGRGTPYEARSSGAELLDTFRAAVDYLQSSGVERIVSWSISNAGVFQHLALTNSLPLSGVVDQVSNNPNLRVLAKRAHVPYFAIRGSYDSRREQGPAELFYPEEHDITEAESFKQLAVAVTPFLRSLPRLPLPGSEPSPNATLVLDFEDDAPGDSPGTAAGRSVLGLAAELSRVCLPESTTVFTKRGNRSVRSGEENDPFRAELLKKSRMLPRLELRMREKGVPLRVIAPENGAEAERAAADRIAAALGAERGESGAFEGDQSSSGASRGCRVRLEGSLEDPAGAESKTRFDLVRGVYLNARTERLAQSLCSELQLLKQCAVPR